MDCDESQDVDACKASSSEPSVIDTIDQQGAPLINGAG